MTAGRQSQRLPLSARHARLLHADHMHQVLFEQRAKVLQAIVLATRGQIDTGLIQLTADDLKALTADVLEKWCQALAPDAYARWKASLADAARERSLCAQQLKALRQAAPQLYTVVADAEVEIVLGFFVPVGRVGNTVQHIATLQGAPPCNSIN